MNFEYYLHGIGLVGIDLGKLPEALYQFMLENNEIERLRNLIHIGALIENFQGMNHSRWDYTVAILYFVQELSNSYIRGIATNRNVGGIFISDRDILQLLGIISNIGHLPGTFSVEKGVVRFLYKRVPDFFSKFKDTTIDYNNLHKLLAIRKLEEWKRIASGEVLDAINCAIYLIKQQIRKDFENKWVQNVMNIFNYARRAAYQLLDCPYINMPVQVLYRDFTGCISYILEDKGAMTAFNTLSDAYTILVYDQIYHSQKSKLTVVKWCNTTYESLMKDQDPTKLIDSWMNLSKLEELRVEDVECEYELIFSAKVPYAFETSFLTDELINYNVDKLELSIEDDLDNCISQILYIPGLREPLTLIDLSAGHISLSVYAKRAMSKKEKIDKLLHFLRWVYNNFNNSISVGVLYLEILRSILIFITELKQVKVEIQLSYQVFKNIDSRILIPEDVIAVEKSYGDNKRLILKRYQLAPKKEIKEKEQKSKFHECECLMELIKRRWPETKRGESKYCVIIPGRIRYIKGRRDICEFDGAIITLSFKGIKLLSAKLFLIEARGGRRAGETSAKKDIRNKIEKLKVEKAKIWKIMRKNAYAELDLINT